MGESEVKRARALLAGITLVPADDGLLFDAGWVGTPGLRSLDAIHLATATVLGDELGGIFSYDDRLCEAARGQGLEVERPA